MITGSRPTLVILDGLAVLDALPERLRARIMVDPATGCWLWQGADSGKGRGGGYGRVWWLGVTTAVHLLVWRLSGQRPLRPGEQLDHRCTARRCCNPEHLTPLYQPHNMRLAHKRRRAARAFIAEAAE